MEYFAFAMGYLFLASSFVVLFYVTFSLISKITSFFSQLSKNIDGCPYDNYLLKSIWGLVEFIFEPKLTVNPELDIEILEGKPFVLVANHQCGSDPAFLLYAMKHLAPKRKLAFLATDYFNDTVPGIKRLLDAAETVYVPYKDRTREKIINNALDKIKEGVCVALFPFGTFHTYKHENSTIEIKTGAAEMAIKGNVPIVVVNIKNIKPRLFNHVFRAIGYYLIHGVSDVEVSVDKIIMPEEFPKNSDGYTNYRILSNTIERSITKENHCNPSTSKCLAVEKLSVPVVSGIFHGADLGSLLFTREFSQLGISVTSEQSTVIPDTPRSELENNRPLSNL